MLLQIFLAALTCMSMLIASSSAAPSAKADHAVSDARDTRTQNGTLNAISKRDTDYVETSEIFYGVYTYEITCSLGSGENCWEEVDAAVSQAMNVWMYGDASYDSSGSAVGWSGDGQICATIVFDVNNWDAYESFQSNAKSDGGYTISQLSQDITDAMFQYQSPAICTLFYDDNSSDGWPGLVAVGWGGDCWDDPQSLMSYC